MIRSNHFRLGITLCSLSLSLLLGCHKPAASPLAIHPDRLKQVMKEKQHTVLFFWTSWCGVSKSIIPKTYLPLADSIVANNIDANVILLCGSSGMDSVVKALNIPGLQSYYTDNKGSGVPMIDRLKMKHYIQSLFPGYDFKKLKGSFTYGIPVTLIVDSNRNIITENGPQDVKNLLHGYL